MISFLFRMFAKKWVSWLILKMQVHLVDIKITNAHFWVNSLRPGTPLNSSWKLASTVFSWSIVEEQPRSYFPGLLLDLLQTLSSTQSTCLFTSGKTVAHVEIFQPSFPGQIFEPDFDSFPLTRPFRLGREMLTIWICNRIEFITANAGKRPSDD